MANVQVVMIESAQHESGDKIPHGERAMNRYTPDMLCVPPAPVHRPRGPLHEIARQGHTARVVRATMDREAVRPTPRSTRP
jgi:hypothetical protein